MSAGSRETVQQTVEAIYRVESPRVLATLVRILGDIDLAEDCMLAAFAAAIEQWPKNGIPANPRAWLVSTGRFKAIDAIRNDTRLFAALHAVATRPGIEDSIFVPYEESSIEDDRLRLIFTCCHPALPNEAQIALVLREVCGLTTDEIAHSFLTSSTTVAQRIVRAKAKIRELKIAYEVPPLTELTDRTESVLRVIYLLFNEGYYASSGEKLTRPSLSEEAIRLGRLLSSLLSGSEVDGLLALMLLQESRRSARVSEAGDLVLLPDQDRSLWDERLIEEGLSICARLPNLELRESYALQAEIASAYVRGAMSGATDWDRIIRCYDLLLAGQPSRIVELNRVVAVSMRDGPAAALEIVNELIGEPELAEYALAYATRGDLLRRLGHFELAAQDYSQALKLSAQMPERRFLEARLQEVSKPSD